MHAGKLNLMAAEIGAVGKPDDIILFLDGDAFPIADPMPAIHQALSESSLLAVRRAENSGDPQPHPCFCAIRVSEWQRLQGDWSPGMLWTNNAGKLVTDVGANLYGALLRTGSAGHRSCGRTGGIPIPCGSGSTGTSSTTTEQVSDRGNLPSRQGHVSGFDQGEGMPLVGRWPE